MGDKNIIESKLLYTAGQTEQAASKRQVNKELEVANFNIEIFDNLGQFFIFVLLSDCHFVILPKLSLTKKIAKAENKTK